MSNKRIDEIANDIVICTISIFLVFCMCYLMISEVPTGLNFNHFVCVKIDVGNYYAVINNEYDKKIGGKGAVFLNSNFSQNVKIVDKDNNIIKEFEFQSDKFDRGYSKNNIIYKE